MTTLGYCASVGWGPRAETPEELAAGIIKMMPAISEIDPIFSHWYTFLKSQIFEPVELRVDSIAEQVAARVFTSESDEPEPAAGNYWNAYNFDRPEWTPRGFRTGLHGGSSYKWTSNSIHLSTADGVDVDMSLVKFLLFKRALLIIAEAFDANFGYAFSNALSALWARGRDAPRIDLGWMTYIGPRFSHLVTPPPTAIVEHRPNGGLFMAATDEPFSTDNPAHMAVARDIQAAAAQFNALPKPYPGLEAP